MNDGMRMMSTTGKAKAAKPSSGKPTMKMPGYRADVLAVLEEMLLDRPDVRLGSMFGLPGFFTGSKKMFVCCFDEGIGLKLPVERVRALQAEDEEIHPHAPGGRLMKEWAYIVRSDPKDYRDDVALIDESIAFVSGNM